MLAVEADRRIGRGGSPAQLEIAIGRDLAVDQADPALLARPIDRDAVIGADQIGRLEAGRELHGDRDRIELLAKLRVEHRRSRHLLRIGDRSRAGQAVRRDVARPDDER